MIGRTEWFFHGLCLQELCTLGSRQCVDLFDGGEEVWKLWAPRGKLHELLHLLMNIFLTSSVGHSGFRNSLAMQSALTWDQEIEPIASLLVFESFPKSS